MLTSKKDRSQDMSSTEMEKKRTKTDRIRQADNQGQTDKQNERKNSRLRASNGQWFPYPA